MTRALYFRFQVLLNPVFFGRWIARFGTTLWFAFLFWGLGSHVERRTFAAHCFPLGNGFPAACVLK